MNQIDISNDADILRAKSSILLPALPYAENALEPVVTAKTLSFHYGKHHKAYVDNLNKLITGTDYSDLSLEEIIKGTSERPERAAIFNNAAQIWNHTFYWNSLSPTGGGEPPTTLKKCLRILLAALMPLRKNLPWPRFHNSEVVGPGLSLRMASSR